MESLLQYACEEGIATLVMDDGKANVMSVAMLGALNVALDRAEQEARVVVLQGRAGMFSGGFDLAAFKRGGPEVLEMLEGGARLSERLLSYPLPVIAACTGHAIAMGAFLLLSTDLRIGLAEGARFQANEVRIGMTVPHFALEVCRLRLAPNQLHSAAVLGMPFSPVQALAAGFLDELVAAEDLAATVQRHAEDLLTLNAEAFVATKRRLRAGAMAAMAQALVADGAAWRAEGIGH